MSTRCDGGAGRIPLEGSAAIAQALDGTEILLLTATWEEAAPLLAAMEAPRLYDVATKTVAFGRLQDTTFATLAIGGCDKANTAHILTCLLQALRPLPALVLQVGIAGAFASATGGALDGPTPRLGDVVLCAEEVYADTGSSSPEGWLSAEDLGLPIACRGDRELGGVFPLDAVLVDAAARAATCSPRADDGAEAPRVLAGRCLTLSQVTGLAAEAAALQGRWHALAESMEGAAAAHVCALYGVPFLEVRGISNFITDRDRSAWEVGRAIAVAAQAALAIWGAFAQDPPPSLAAWREGARHRGEDASGGGVA